MFETVRKLVDAPAISGYEKNVRDLLSKELKKHVDEIRVDKVGNLIARKGKGSPKIMLAAHMDEVGLIVKHVNKEGFILFDKIGGWDQRILPANRVSIHGSKGPVLGVIGSKPVHMQEEEERKKPEKIKNMFIDVGASGEGDVKKAGISVGDFITMQGSAEKLSGSRITGHGFDNRIGCSVLVEVARRLKTFKGTLYLVGTIGEEMGLIGIRGSAYGVNPDAVLAIDTTIGADTPGIPESESILKLGKGPSLELKDAISVINPQVKKWVTDTAAKAKMKLQVDVMCGGATDASVVPMIREGIPAGSLAVPTRYLHTPIEVADMKDIEDCVKLCVKLTESAHSFF